MYPPGPRPSHYPRPPFGRPPYHGPPNGGPPSSSGGPGSSGQSVASAPDSRFGPPPSHSISRPPMPGPRPNHVSFDSVKDEYHLGCSGSFFSRSTEEYVTAS